MLCRGALDKTRNTMKLFCLLAYWVGAALMGICFLPLILIAVIVGFGSYVAGRFANFGWGCGEAK